MLLSVSTRLAAGNELFDQADAYARAGDINKMLMTYEIILKDNPDNIRALNGKGTALSWLMRFNDSQNTFLYVLDLEPNNIEALNGLGYAYAWGKNYNRAKITFQHSLAIDNHNLSAHKGLALSHLWSGDYHQAIKLFNDIEQSHFDDAEIYSGLGQSHLSLGQTKRAYDSFKKSLALEDNRYDALIGIKSAYSQPSKSSLSAWYGTTSDGDAGIRLLEATYWLNRKTKGFLIYDNSLSLDNPSLARNDDNAESYEAGVFHEFNYQWLGTASIGYRDLPDKQHQNIYKAEAAKFINDHIFKGGIQISPHSEDYTDHVYHFSYGFPFTEKLKLEPTLYFSETGGTNDDEWRAVLNGHYVFDSGWELNVSSGYGDIDSDINGASGSVKVLSSTLTIPVGFHRVHLRGLFEDNPTNDFSVLMIGFTARFPYK